MISVSRRSLRLQSRREQLKIAAVEHAAKAAAQPAVPGAFTAGTLVVLTLHSPREKFWGALRELSTAGLSVCGIELNSFDDFAAMVKAGEGAPGVVFFPMQRVERMEIDASNGAISSMADRFAAQSGRTAASVLAGDDDLPGGRS